ncbi:MAG: hypothetical protein FD165_2628 [Gammaproteobacteria bacterium]|nr:MAG: hypothetical protein FD165_2628 [Gammaproteobacteria bacterium]TND01601.1 MAG: hypothetical protein FD120_2549 [Gammaproteobacteria bacterium]
MSATLKAREMTLLDILGRVMYATPRQLEQWGLPQSAISRMLPRLTTMGLVSVVDDTRPNVVALTHKGGAVVNRPLPSGKSYTSWPVMAHRCCRNAVELELRKTIPRFTFFSRKYAFASGLNPSRGEHGGSDADGNLYLVLIDDYLMEPRRIAHCWTRPHAPNPRYYSETASRHWQDLAQHLIVFATDQHQVARHQAFIEKCQAIKQLVAAGVARSTIRHTHGLNTVATIDTYASLPDDVAVHYTPPLWDIR